MCNFLYMNYVLTVGLEEGERDGPFDGEVVGSNSGMFGSEGV